MKKHRHKLNQATRYHQQNSRYGQQNYQDKTANKYLDENTVARTRNCGPIDYVYSYTKQNGEPYLNDDLKRKYEISCQEQKERQKTERMHLPSEKKICAIIEQPNFRRRRRRKKKNKKTATKNDKTKNSNNTQQTNEPIAKKPKSKKKKNILQARIELGRSLRSTKY